MNDFILSNFFQNLQSEVESIKEGDECGVGLIDFELYEPGDIIESYVETK